MNSIRHLTSLMLVSLGLMAALNAEAQRSLGMNVGFPSDYGGEWVFTDMVKTHRLMQPTDPWGQNRPPVNVDAIGWPTQDCSLFLWHVNAGLSSLMRGRYAVSFTGKADVTLMIGSGTVGSATYSAGTNRTTLNIDFNGTEMGGITLKNTRRTAAGALNSGVTDLRVMRPIAPGSTTAYAPTVLFTESYLSVLRPFAALRIMDWTATNWNQATQWSQRVLPSEPNQQSSAPNYGWQGRGAAWEYAIQLANTLGKDLWICVPALADSNYVTQLARLFRDGSSVNGVTYAGLNPQRKLYIEYSNEVWNWGFGQAQQNLQAVKAEVTGGSTVYNFDGQGGTEPWRRRIGKRTIEISRAFRQEFGDAAMMTRIRPVLAWQQDNGQATATEALMMAEHMARQANRTVADEIYAGGGSAYYNPDNGSDTLTLDNIWSSATFASSAWFAPQRNDADVAAAYGLRRVAYEGGPSMDALGHSEAVKAAAVKDPRIIDLMLRQHQLWEETGADLLFYFCIVGDFQWGFMSDTQNSDTQKMRAITQIKAATPVAPTLGSVVPGDLPGGEYDLASRGWGYPGNGTGEIRISPKEWMSWTVRPSAPGRYTVQVHANVDQTGTYRVWANGQPGPVLNVNATGGQSQLLPTTTTVVLRSGVNGIRVENLTTGNLYVMQVQVRRVVRPVAGRISFTDFQGDLSQVTLQVEVRPDGTGEPFRQAVRLDANGGFSVNADVVGAARVWVQARRWLADRRDALTIGPIGITGLQFTGRPGDADGDNAVTVFDYDRLSQAFDRSTGSAGWDGDCDFDGDGSLTVFDYDLLSANFDASGPL